MTEQELINISGISVGFCAAIFFCIGNIFNSADRIHDLSGTYVDSNEFLAQALAAQRAQYVVGGLLLVISFLLQIVATLASEATLVALPQWIGTGLRLVLFEITCILLVGMILALILYKTTMRQVRGLSMQ